MCAEDARVPWSGARMCRLAQETPVEAMPTSYLHLHKSDAAMRSSISEDKGSSTDRQLTCAIPPIWLADDLSPRWHGRRHSTSDEPGRNSPRPGPFLEIPLPPSGHKQHRDHTGGRDLANAIAPSAATDADVLICQLADEASSGGSPVPRRHDARCIRHLHLHITLRLADHCAVYEYSTAPRACHRDSALGPGDWLLRLNTDCRVCM